MKNQWVYFLVSAGLLVGCQSGIDTPNKIDLTQKEGKIQEALDEDWEIDSEVKELVYSSDSVQALAKFWPNIKVGSRGGRVSAIQYLLKMHGIHSGGRVDGKFGLKTKRAVKDFQRKKGLAVDGIAGKNTWTALVMDVRRGDRRKEVVKAVQVLVGTTVDGIFGPKTERAVKSFQQRNKLHANGVVNLNTWRILVAGGNVDDSPSRGKINRDTVVQRAKKWVDIGLPYSQKKYHKGWRTDCSGMVSMAWNLRNSRGKRINATTHSLPMYSYKLKHPKELRRGDAINRRKNGSGHVVLFVRWTNYSQKKFIAYEQRGRKWGAVKTHRRLIYKSGRWIMAGKNVRAQFLRYKNVKN